MDVPGTSNGLKRYFLRPTTLVPNSPLPVLHYPRYFDGPVVDPKAVHSVFAENGWCTQWIFRYGSTQDAHYHSAAHECMAVLSGEATVRFGAADTSSDLEESTHGASMEVGGVELHARAGDVFVLPAGTAHKTFDTAPPATFQLLTPGDGHALAAADAAEALGRVELSGFTMIGAYPKGSVWDFAKGGEHVGDYQKVWSVPKPERDPVLGSADAGLCGQW